MSPDTLVAFSAAIILGSALACVGYLFPGSDTARQEIFQIASSLVTGALGFFAGHALNKSTPPPVNPVPTQVDLNPKQ